MAFVMGRIIYVKNDNDNDLQQLNSKQICRNSITFGVEQIVRDTKQILT